MGKFVVKETASGIKFDLLAANREVIATSEVYNSKASCLKGIASVTKNAVIASVEDQTAKEVKKEINPKFEIYKDKAGEFRFRLKAKNGQIIATSEGYKAKASCKNGIESVRRNVVNAEVVEIKQDK
ncbi:MAG: YegP family protein [Clostridia bacterium]|nr:YegP family protein [Clostridia bacterium]